MSESILRTLMQLFALISDIGNTNEISTREKDVVKSFLARHLNSELIDKYLRIFEEYLDLFINREAIKERTAEDDIPALKTLRIKRICEGINTELRQKQKIYIVIQLIDFISHGKEITQNELDFLMVVALALKVPENEYRNIKSFIIDTVSKIQEKDKVLQINSSPAAKFRKIKHIYIPGISGELLILNISSVKTFILRYTGDKNLFLNGQHIFPRQTYLFDNGSTIKGEGLNTLYYSEVFDYFNDYKVESKISFAANNISFKFADSDNGIRNFNFYEESGQLVGILGVSGTGKSTLLNLLNGNLKPHSGSILINGYDLNNPKEREKLIGVIGYIPQDDLLIEELTVYQNLIFNARLCLSNFSEVRIRKSVNRIMVDLDLWDIRNLRVGNPLDKVISGGQRKRINIALELLREPYILFVDEPTSGLSSVDSEVVINLLKDLTYKGKLVIVNIHQPCSDLYKLFDKVIILDKGGYQIFYGNPNEAVIYFKTHSRQANPDEDQCTKCGNINADQVLQIVEAKIVDEHGKLTKTRKVSPREWSQLFREHNKEQPRVTQVQPRVLPENFYSIPGKLRQMGIFFSRDLLSKLANRQYIIINLLGAPLLALLLGYFTRYTKGGSYKFMENDNLTAYLFMCIITSLFLGLIISSEEILKDRKILKRESFLNLSWFSYINSKIALMFIISAIQAISFILVGNSILGIKGMTLPYWIVLFTTSCCANLIGLNLSSALNSVITIYILIPFILIPQLLFSGVLVKYEKLHTPGKSSGEFVPIIGELMPARWSFEALAVEQFKNNRFEKLFFNYDMEVSHNTWLASYLVNNLYNDLYSSVKATEFNDTIGNNLKKLDKYIGQMLVEAGYEMPDPLARALKINALDPDAFVEIGKYLDFLKKEYRKRQREAMNSRDSVIKVISASLGSDKLQQLKNEYLNKSLDNFILNKEIQDKIIETPRSIIQKLEPGFKLPTTHWGRSHFCAPFKIVGNLKIDTFIFNLIVIWLLTFVLYIALYFNLLRRIVSGPEYTIRKEKQDSRFLDIKEISSW